MPYLAHYNQVRTHEPLDDPFHSRPLVRRNSKRQRVFDDDEYDDYPPTVKPSQQVSRALTIRQPSQLERYNVFNTPHERQDKHKHHHSSNHKSHRSVDVHRYYVERPSERDTGREEDEEWDYETERERERDEISVRVKATISRPRRHSHSHFHEIEKPAPMVWTADQFKRKERWERVDWESHESKKSGGAAHYHYGHGHGHGHGGFGFWSDDDCGGGGAEGEVTRDVRYRKVKRTKTEEWKPLVGFRRL